MSAPAEGRSAKRLSARDWLASTQAAQRIVETARRRAMSAPAEGRSAKRLSARDWLGSTQAARRIASPARRRGRGGESARSRCSR